MTSNSNAQAQNQRKSNIKNALIEMLRGRGGASGDKPYDRVMPFGDSPIPSFDRFRQEAEEERKKNEELRRILYQKQAQERLIFSAKEKQRLEQLKTIRDELLAEVKKVDKSSQSLVKEVEFALSAEIVEAGEYQFSMFTWIKEQLRGIFLKINESRNLLALFKGRQGRLKGAQLVKRGTQFTQAGDRVTAFTAAG